MDQADLLDAAMPVQRIQGGLRKVGGRRDSRGRALEKPLIGTSGRHSVLDRQLAGVSIADSPVGDQFRKAWEGLLVTHSFRGGMV